MRSSILLHSTNWKHVFGELLLIVVGVTLALMASSWYENWRERQDERQSLQQISLALEADLGFLQERFETLTQSERDLRALLELLRRDELSLESQVYFRSVAAWRGVRMRTGPYDELKARGLSLVSNRSLRLKLVNLYDSAFGALQGVTANDEVFSRDQMLPYMFRNFRDVGTDDLGPVDSYAELDSDIYFENLVAAKHARLEVRLLPAYKEILALAREVLTDIRSELSEART